MKGVLFLTLFALAVWASLESEEAFKARLEQRVQEYDKEAASIPKFPLDAQETFLELKERLLEVAAMRGTCLVSTVPDSIVVWIKDKALAEKLTTWTTAIPKTFSPPAYQMWSTHLDAVLDMWRRAFPSFPATRNGTHTKICWKNSE